ncbi:uncharacterized protein N7483_011140 [Penicillium malachiteum]|uniref:uncharacterized protein n=1 Tax=Penicillium malachiteum TaxID=1324776 RepID=UPI002548BECA|nr:uncharacterized protein N7483_011140 [Penicillium malachiteum]KAJ5713959.1 hypothetical protein N7483_011140 [Penicillium malachiteum]
MNVIEAVQQFAALGDIVVGGSQNIIACGIWTAYSERSLVVSALIHVQLVTKHSSYLEKLSTLFMVAGRSAPRYEKMALLYPRSKNLQSYMCDYYITIVQICQKILKFSLKSTLGQLAAALNETELNSFQLNLERWATNIKEEVTLLMAEKIENEALKTSKFQNALWKKLGKSDDDAHQARINARLRVLNFCSEFDHTVIWKQTRKAGTTRLFKESPEYTTWKDPALSCISCTLVYTGKLGSGKSVMLANMVDDLYLHSQDIPVAYFFCRHDVAKTLQSRTIIGSLIRQILSNLETSCFTELLDTLIPCAELDEYDKMAVLLEKGFESRRLQCFLVIDGLDDLSAYERVVTIAELSKIQEKVNIHLCVSFRSDPTSHKRRFCFEDFDNATVMPIPDNTSEIQAFILEELEACLENQKLVVGDPTLILEIREALFNGSQGMFLWAALQIETMCSMKTDFELRQSLQNLPQDLAETFSRVLQRLDGKEQSQQMAILKLIIAAQRPLTIFEMQEALSVIPGDTEWDPSRNLNNVYATLATCGCLINIDEEELTTRLVHPSLKQFLLGSDAQLKTAENPFIITLDAAHGYMADITITYLNYDVFEKQLTRTLVPRVDASTAASMIVQSTVSSFSSSTSIRQLAIKLLKAKSTTEVDFNIGNSLSQVRPLCRSHPRRDFYFYDYARVYWHSHIARTVSHTARMKSLLTKVLKSRRIDMDHLDEDDLTPLMCAAALGNTDVVRSLLSLDEVDINFQNDAGLTALHLALLQKHSETLGLLLDAPGLDINRKDGQGRTVLLIAAEQGDSSIFKEIYTGRQLDVTCANIRGETALHIAAKKGLLEIAVLLLKLDEVDVNAKDVEGNTPLHRAILSEQIGIVEQFLICERVNIDVENNRGRSVLSMTISSGNEEMAHLFLHSRLDENSKARLKEVLLPYIGSWKHVQYTKYGIARWS